jgi:predicted amidohydrolase
MVRIHLPPAASQQRTVPAVGFGFVANSTAAPAKILGYEGTVGTLSPGANADVAVFELRDGNVPLRDSTLDREEPPRGY